MYIYAQSAWGLYEAPSTEGLSEDPLCRGFLKPLCKSSKGASWSPFYKRDFMKLFSTGLLETLYRGFVKPICKAFKGASQSPFYIDQHMCMYVCMCTKSLCIAFSLLGLCTHIHTHKCTFQSFMLLIISCSWDTLGNNNIQLHIKHMLPLRQLTANWSIPVHNCTQRGVHSTSYSTFISTSQIISNTVLSTSYLLDSSQPAEPFLSYLSQGGPLHNHSHEVYSTLHSIFTSFEVNLTWHSTSISTSMGIHSTCTSPGNPLHGIPLSHWGFTSPHVSCTFFV